MQSYTYHYEVKDLLTQFLQAFDGAVVKRYNDARVASNVVGVRYVYAPKQRVLHDLVNKAQHITLPAISFWISGISRDTERVFNKLEGQYWVNTIAGQQNSSVADHNLQPVPINIELSVSLLTRFQTDMDQLISNFVPYSDPYFVISWTREDMPGHEIRAEVLWNGSLAMSYPIEQDAGQQTRVVCDTSFTLKGWLFKSDANPVGRIFKIDTNFYPVSGTPTFQNIDDIIDPTSTESFVLSGRPILPYSSRTLTPIYLSAGLELQGDMFDYTSAIYLSGADGMFSTISTINPFLSSSSLSAIYPALSGVSNVLDYSIMSNNRLALTYPAPSAVGRFDIIIVNDAGYNTLTNSAYNINYSTQLDYVSGIEVVIP